MDQLEMKQFSLLMTFEYANSINHHADHEHILAPQQQLTEARKLRRRPLQTKV